MESASFMTREEMRKLASDMNVIGQTNSIVNGLLAIEHSFACSSSTSNPKNSFSSSLMDNDDIFQILDFGCYDGRYSLKAIDPIVKKVKELNPEKRISVTHVDTPDNDFNSLIKSMWDDPSSYARNFKKGGKIIVHTSACPLYESCAFPNSIDYLFSSLVHCPSRVASSLTSHVIPSLTSDAERKKWDDLSKQDWNVLMRNFTSMVKPGGKLFLVIPGSRCHKPIMDTLYSILENMRVSHQITPEERERIGFPVHLRSFDEYKEWFSKSPHWKVDNIFGIAQENPYFTEFITKQNNPQKFAQFYVSSFKAWTEDVIMKSFSQSNGNWQQRVDKLYKDIRDHIQRDPQKYGPADWEVIYVAATRTTTSLFAIPV